MFDKMFKISYLHGLTLVNAEEKKSYIYEKAEHFKNYENYSNKEERLRLFCEICEMIDHDIETAEFDLSEIADCVGFPFNEQRENMIRFYDIAHILGSIFLLVFDEGENRLRNVLDGVNGAIRTSDMFIHAYNGLITCKEVNRTSESPIYAYGATLIFATLLECELKKHVRSYYAKRYLSVLRDKINAAEIEMTAEDNDYFRFLACRYDLTDSAAVNNYDTISAFERQYELFVKYSIIDENDDLKEILKENQTLNNLLNNPFFIEICDERFRCLATNLFGTRRVNLRNNLAHCNFDRMNYYALSVTALLYELVSMVSQEFYLKDEI